MGIAEASAIKETGAFGARRLLECRKKDRSFPVTGCFEVGVHSIHFLTTSAEQPGRYRQLFSAVIAGRTELVEAAAYSSETPISRRNQARA